MDPELAAHSIYEFAEEDPLAPPGAIRLATALLGPNSVFTVRPDEVWGNGELNYEEGRWTVLISSALDPAAREFTLYHECFEYWLKLHGHGCDTHVQKESLADRGAACLQAPRPAFEDALARFDEKFATLAWWFAATPTAMALRLGEVTGVPVCVVGPTTVRVRGAEFSWPDEPTVRRVLRTGDHPGLRSVALSQDRTRAALVAA